MVGSAKGDKGAWGGEKPQHNLSLDEYLIGKYPVTNAQFAIYAKATKRDWKIPAGKQSHPVVDVTWYDAIAFCEWATQFTGRIVKLPSEVEWEKAARGSDGRFFPWGNQKPDATRCNYNANIQDTTPVGQYSPAGDSPYGVADMAGNVAEWTTTIYKPYPYNADDGREILRGHENRVMRGQGFNSTQRYIRAANRSYVSSRFRRNYVGFRVVVSVPVS